MVSILFLGRQGVVFLCVFMFVSCKVFPQALLLLRRGAVLYWAWGLGGSWLMSGYHGQSYLVIRVSDL